jgi:hypothetical protein
MSFNLPSSNTGNILTGIAGLMTGVGQLMGARQQTSVGEYNATISEQQAQSERASQQLLEFQKRKIIKSQIGSQVSAAGSSGFRFTGDPITIMQDSLANAEMDIAIDRYNSEVKARGYQSTADMERYQAKQKASMGYVGASNSFLSTAADIWKTQTVGTKGTKLGAGTTTYGIKLPSRYIPPK